jgi:hypothetical protein
MGKQEQDTIAVMKDEHAKEMEMVIQEMQGWAAERQKEMIANFKAQQAQRNAEMLKEALEANAKRTKQLPTVPVDSEMDMRRKIEAELKDKMAEISKAEQLVATRERRLQIAEKVSRG